MTIIPDEMWPRISEAAGGLPDEARAEIESLLRPFNEGEWLATERISQSTKDLLDKAMDYARKLLVPLAALERSQDFRWFNHGGTPANVEQLTHVRTSIEQLLDTLATDRRRLYKKSARDAELKVQKRLVHGLLEIRARYLRTGFPLQEWDTPDSGKFTQYVKLCLRCVDLSEAQAEGILWWVTRDYAKHPKTRKKG